MSTYEIVYFPGRGRAEVARQILVEAGVEFKDTRLPKDQWVEEKPNTPFGQIPVLRVTEGGKTVQINDSFAIETYLGEVTGLQAESAAARAQNNGALLASKDAATTVIRAIWGPAEQKEASIAKFAEESLPVILANVDKAIAATDGPFLNGDKLVWQDIALHALFGEFFHVVPGYAEQLAKHEAVAGLVKAVKARPAIAKWIETRPESQF